ncbi:hypothetical protein CIRG_05413 [Coccidioides immitis RMSCC 2394]|uniref:Uncharacterized protein n=2 Tax=Coccidioides TaxID=5500 RepID=A0A0J7B6Z2_COCIT|nr:hypothetical protein CPAG_07331 [Coccidioides posadasii RMSCC 3488]KMP05732.1 hypothetical protein CIRG_05413 [Coccidioides immitis RMSCC 2394]
MSSKYTPSRENVNSNKQYTSRAESNERPNATARTPKFIFSSSAQSGFAAQFAATPRFVFSQRQNRKSGDGIDVSDKGSSPAARARKTIQDTPRNTEIKMKEVIEDSEGEEEGDLLQGIVETSRSGRPENEPGKTVADDDDEEMLLSFSLSQHQAKRRRLSISSADDLEVRPVSARELDQISSTSSESPPSSPQAGPASPSAGNVDNLLSPTVHPMPSTPFQPTGAASVPHHSSSRGPPRFMFSTPISSTPRQPSGSNNATTAQTSTQRQKPRFVLPQTPSRRREPDISALLTSPIPFPYAKRHARSKSRTFIPGGMASEVRNWILDLGTRKQVSQSQAPPQTTQTQADQGEREQPFDKYQLIVQVGEIRTSAPTDVRRQGGQRQGRLGHPAPFTLISPSKVQPPTASQNNILLFGSPVSTVLPPMQKLQKGDWVGIRRGLVWDMEIEPFHTGDASNNNANPEESDTISSIITRRTNVWLVSIEWDIIRKPEPGGSGT